jgi:hypothetical protein
MSPGKAAQRRLQVGVLAGGDTRRKNGDTLKLYAETRDTMACRFYDRFARRSPCEGSRLGPGIKDYPFSM